MATATLTLGSQNRWLADGYTTDWNFNFAGGYISTDHVFAYSTSNDVVPVRHDYTITSGSFVSQYVLRITPAVSDGHTLVIYRDSRNNGLPLADFVDGGGINETDLDAIARQSIFVNQETLDSATTQFQTSQPELFEQFSASTLNEVDSRIAIETAARLSYSAQLAGPTGGTAIGFDSTTVDAKLRAMKSIADMGVRGAGAADESAAVTTMIATHNYLYIPAGFTVQCKNIQLLDNTLVVIDGKVKLPGGCSDFDRMFYAANKTGIRIYAREIDGNYAGQSGNIGTHLIYLTGCTAPHVWVDYIHDHYIASGASMPSVDGIRDSSSGPIFVQAATGGRVHVGRMENWGREGVYTPGCAGIVASLTRAVAGVNNSEYSGIQVGGSYNKILWAHVEGSNGSGIGFDTTDGTATNLTAINCRAQQGINCGHPGRPASRSVLSNIIVDGCYGHGIGIAASSEDVVVSNFHVRNAGGFGISTSDSASTSRFSNGVVENSGLANVNALATEVTLANVDTAKLDVTVLTATTVSGTFTEGETVTASGGGSGTLRKYISNLTGSERKYFLSAGSGTWTGTLAGGTSGATATITASSTPAEFSELSGGTVAVVDGRYLTGSVGNQTRYANGSATYTHSTFVAATAGTLHTVTLTFASNVLWAAAPVPTVTVTTVSATGTYTLQTLRAQATTTTCTISFKADVSQTYGLGVTLSGRWK
jgi:hypothetical protein